MISRWSELTTTGSTQPVKLVKVSAAAKSESGRVATGDLFVDFGIGLFVLVCRVIQARLMAGDLVYHERDQRAQNRQDGQEDAHVVAVVLDLATWRKAA